MEALKHIWKKMALAALILAGMGYSVDVQAAASKKNVMCVKTNTGHYFPVVRVSMMVVADGASTFEIVLKDGEGEANVESISFEKHEEMIDFELYRLNSDGTPYLDMMKPSWLITSTGKFFKTMDVTNMLAKEGSDRFDVVTTNGTEYDVAYVYFLRNTEDFVKEYIQTGIDQPLESPAVEKLQLMTPIREQMTLSGCGNATVAQVYSVDGKLQTEAAVLGGNTTIQVGHLPAGVYVVRVGNKSLKFSKK
ncbi:MAG: T9SS type A sorting domain-containing protein [Prevotella sp.]|nr:T9SS type A sorting domain-containing protein [Prevotella sp.]